MSFSAVFNFPGHVFVGHIIPALFFYVLGLYYSLNAFRLLTAEPRLGKRNNRSDRRVGIFMIICGLIYSLFYAIEAIAVSSLATFTRSMTYSATGICFMSAGMLKFIFSYGYLRDITLDPSMLIGFGAISLGVFFRGDYDTKELNAMHYTSAVFLILSGVTDLAIQLVERKLLSLLGMLLLISSALLTASSDEIVHWATREGVHLGLGPLVIICFLFALLHLIVFAWKARHHDPFSLVDYTAEVLTADSPPYTTYFASNGQTNDIEMRAFSIGTEDDDAQQNNGILKGEPDVDDTGE